MTACLVITLLFAVSGTEPGGNSPSAHTQMGVIALTQLEKYHPKAYLLQQIDSEIHALSLWSKSLQEDATVLISSSNYEDSFAAMVHDGIYVADVIDDMRSRLAGVRMERQLGYFEECLLSEAYQAIEDRKDSLYSAAKMQIQEMTDLLADELEAFVTEITHASDLESFRLRLRLNFLDLPSPEKEKVSSQLVAIAEHKDGAIRAKEEEVTRTLQAYRTQVHRELERNIEQLEQVYIGQALDNYEKAIQHSFFDDTGTMLDSTGVLAESIFLHKPSGMWLDIPQLGEIQVNRLSQGPEYDYSLSEAWLAREIDRLSLEKQDLKRSIIDDIKSTALRIGREYDIQVVFVEEYDESIAGVDLSKEVLDTIHKRYSWSKGDD